MSARPGPRFCGICGRRVPLLSATLGDRVAYCAEHAAAVKRAERLPADELERLPTMADEAAAELRRAEREAELELRRSEAELRRRPRSGDV
jgi:hypothetical protein